MLRGKIEGNDFTERGFHGYAGPTIKGTFEALRNRRPTIFKTCHHVKDSRSIRSIANLIAAGEVVERPASVAKGWSARLMQAQRASSSMSSQVDAGC